MPTKKPKLYHLIWKETLYYSAVVETKWTPEELASPLMPEGEENPVYDTLWETVLGEQIEKPLQHVQGRELEYLGAIQADPIDTDTSDLPQEKKDSLLDHIRELTVRKWDKPGAFKEAVLMALEESGLGTVEPGEWGVLDRTGQWAIYKVSEKAAVSYWEKHQGSWRLCSSITSNEQGEGYVVADERKENAPQ